MYSHATVNTSGTVSQISRLEYSLRPAWLVIAEVLHVDFVHRREVFHVRKEDPDLVTVSPVLSR